MLITPGPLYLLPVACGKIFTCASFFPYFFYLHVVQVQSISLFHADEQLFTWTAFYPGWVCTVHGIGDFVIPASPLARTVTFQQGWEFAHSLIDHSLILLKSIEWLWAICSDRSRQMSDCERIAQVVQDKWATMSDLLRSLMINDQMRISLKKFWLQKSKILFLVCFLKDRLV